MTKVIGILLFLSAAWLMYKIMRPYPPSRPVMGIRERQELRRKAHEKPYNPRFPYGPQNKHRYPF